MNNINKIKRILKTIVMTIVLHGVTYCSYDPKQHTSMEPTKLYRTNVLGQNLAIFNKATVDDIQKNDAVALYYDQVLKAVEGRGGQDVFVDYTDLPDPRQSRWFHAVTGQKSKICTIFEQYFESFRDFNLDELKKRTLDDYYKKFLAHIFTLAQDPSCWKQQIRYVEDKIKLTKGSRFARLSKTRFAQPMDNQQTQEEMDKAEFLFEALADSALRAYNDLAVKQAEQESTRTRIQKLTLRGKAQAPDYYILAVFSAFKKNFPKKYDDFRRNMLKRLETYLASAEVSQGKALLIKENIERKTEPGYLAKYGKYIALGVGVAAVGTLLWMHREEGAKTQGGYFAKSKAIVGATGRTLGALPGKTYTAAKDLPGQIYGGIKATPGYLAQKGRDIYGGFKNIPTRAGELKTYLGGKVTSARTFITEIPKNIKDRWTNRGWFKWNGKEVKVDQGVDGKGNTKEIITDANKDTGTINTQNITSDKKGNVTNVTDQKIDLNKGTVSTVQMVKDKVTDDLKLGAQEVQEIAGNAVNKAKELIGQDNIDAATKIIEDSMKKGSQEPPVLPWQ